LNWRQKWTEQWMVPTGYTCTNFLLVQGCRSGRKLCGKIGFGDKLSNLNMCYFRDFK
jgi:hypothetical protein